MGIITLDRHAQYDELLRSWHKRRFIPKSAVQNWTQTAKAGAVTFWPVGGTELKPVVDYIFTETPPSNGQPKAPDNPSTITGVTSITVTHCESVGVDETVYTVSLGSTYYGGTIDLATGVMAVTWEGRVLDGTEGVYLNASLGTVNRFAVFKGFTIPNQQQACTHFNYSSSWDGDTVHFYIPIDTTGYVWIYSSEASAVDFKAWLSSQHSSGTPVVIVYKPATPYTVQLSPLQLTALAQPDKYTPRLNTIYTDASAVQIGYVKSPIREEYELTQAIIATAGE